MEKDLPVEEGNISFWGYKTWYGIVGEKEEPGKIPLVCLHGGTAPINNLLSFTTPLPG